MERAGAGARAGSRIKSMDSRIRIRIRTKMSRIRNTVQCMIIHPGQVLSVTLVRYQDAASRRLVVEFIHVALAKSPEAVARTIHAGLLEVSLSSSANLFKI
jgi:hypothetical protein